MNKKVALILMCLLLGIVLVFHFLILLEQIPYDRVWAGRLDSVEEMRVFETVSILVNLVMLAVLHAKYRLIQKQKTSKAIDAVIWLFAVVFALNTLGNLFAENMLERVFGTLFTFVSSALCIIIAWKGKGHTGNA